MNNPAPTRNLNPTAAYAAAVAVVATLLWTTGAVHHNFQLVDTVAYLDAVWRMYLGQVPHRDFHNLVGALPEGVAAWLMHLTQPDANALAYANAVFFVLLCAAGWPLLRARYGAAVAAAVNLGLGFVLIAPRMLGYDPDLTTYAINYNRLGWAFMGVVILAILQPRRDGSPTRPAEWLLLGLLSAGLLYTKINFGLVSLFALAGLWIRERRPWRALLWTAAGLGAMVVLCRLAWGVDPLAYSRDIEYALKAHPEATLVSRAWETLKPNFEGLAILAILLVVAWPQLAAGLRSDPGVRWLAWGVPGSVGLGFLLALTNTHRGPIPILAVAGFALAEACRRAIPLAAAEAAALRHRVVLMLSMLWLGVVAVPDMFATTRAMAWHWLKEGPGNTHPRLDGVFAPLALPLLPGENPAELAAAIAARPPEHFGMTSPELKADFDDAIALLRANGRTSGRILSLDFVNPFHLILRTVPPRGDWICWDPSRNFSPRAHIEPEELFADVTDVLVPKRSFSLDFSLAKSRIYAPFLAENFQLRGETALWTLYVRTTAGPGRRGTAAAAAQALPAAHALSAGAERSAASEFK